ncbi:effector-associated constant component EACC1 [Ktedonobacter racemifer]|uniref:Uncharacterized protein n=1 Tax=Ktedonobacter racemifer DSM 44963 TaxID=485913 RepID=D6TGS7_KTERA|nr:hypothetical protein [Ktedonobacter racemifer]EFH88856.1 hypothetical protein Krac_10360 [Ktedonobacter racemifer DSM 44963]
MDQYTYLITFDDISSADANQYAQELREFVLDAVPDANVQRKRSDLRTQDWGTILEIVLGSASVVSLAQAVGNWLQRRQSVSLTFKRPEGDVIVQNVNNKTVLKLTELLLQNAKE